MTENTRPHQSDPCRLMLDYTLPAGSGLLDIVVITEDYYDDLYEEFDPAIVEGLNDIVGEHQVIVDTRLYELAEAYLDTDPTELCPQNGQTLGRRRLSAAVDRVAADRDQSPTTIRNRYRELYERVWDDEETQPVDAFVQTLDSIANDHPSPQ